jgi:1-acyl-sn-glycerol-3-phosphate acyltransferase
MRQSLQLIRSVIFIVQMYAAMAVYALIWTIPALVSRELAYRAVHAYCDWVRKSAAVLVGLRSEIRGPVPMTEVLIAAKHQSFFDIILIASAVPRPKFIMKRELIYAPILGQFALRIGCIPVDRGGRGQAVIKMKADVARGAALPGQLVIYPQGTRVAPGDSKPYKVGAGLLYSQLDQTCVPAATNVGVFWPKRGLMRHPGLAVVEFLAPIEPGLPTAEFMARVEVEVESASNRLMREAGRDLKGAGNGNAG